MGYARVLSIALVGLTGHPVEVEADLSAGLPGLTVSGLPDAALNEARERVRAAMINSGVPWPNRRITINLLPASLPKHGSIFDLAVATALLCAAGVVPTSAVAGTALLGELGLDGKVRSVRGVLPAVLAAARAGVRRVVVPLTNTHEAALVPDLAVLPAETLARLIDVLRGAEEPPAVPAAATDPVLESTVDLSEVVGQDRGRRAVEIAAAGGHNLAFFGPPGVGKTMLAERLPSILPTLDDEAALEVTAVHSVAGALGAGGNLIRRPPYQAPHHTSTIAALVGGGSGTARPGAVSLAHRGVLMLDEAPQFRPTVLNALREPLESGWVQLARVDGHTRYPARVQLVIAANPCPCGEAGGRCACTPAVRRRYFDRLSGPLLDRVDLQVDLLPVRAAHLLVDGANPEPSAAVRHRVEQARATAAQRWAGAGVRLNADVSGTLLRSRPWRLPGSVTWAADQAVDRGLLSARGYHRVLRLAWTLSDLAGRDRPDEGDLAEAIDFRTRRLT